MFDNIPSTKPIPMDIKQNNTGASTPHWCYDTKTAGGVRNSRSMSFSSPSSSYLSQSPAFGGSLGSGGNMAAAMAGPAKRRNSLKNMVHLCDFATP